jgi:hypothetical protein
MKAAESATEMGVGWGFPRAKGWGLMKAVTLAPVMEADWELRMRKKNSQAE